MSRGMETFDARLASFDTVLHPGKRRSSTAKSGKAISWPHSTPSPAELAHAGFYYEPHETNPDNTRCFLCESALDGWEEEDNPITEHLTLSKNCGWAIMMDIQRHSSNPAEIEDPTSEKIAQARSTTFGLLWPHDGKRGWVCQSEKMVSGGWYFCANEESNDLASCPYCKLSLDGWEPKDDPYDEHYRRSSDCSFFVFAQHPGKKTKTSRPKKSRTSKASRLSTQSTASEAPTAVDLDDPTDQSIIAPETTTKTKNTKKASKSKSKPTKSKKADTADSDDQMDVDGTEYTNPEPPKPKRTTRGKKRSSHEVDQDDDHENEENTEPPEPAPKRRATKTRSSAIPQDSGMLNEEVPAFAEEQDEAAPQEEEEPKKGRRTTKKNSSSKGRKASETSTTSKAASSSRVPDDAELDAALEADLETEAPNTEEQYAEMASKRTSKKSKYNNKSKSIPEESIHTEDTPTDHIEKSEGKTEIPGNDQMEPSEDELLARTKSKSSKNTSKRGTKKSQSQEADRKSRTSPEVDMRHAETSIPERQESFISVEIPARDPEQISEVEPINEGETKKSKKTSADKGKKSKKTNKLSEPKEKDAEVEDTQGQKPAEAELEILDQKEEAQEPEPEQELQVADKPARRRSSNIPPKTVVRYSDIADEKPLAKSFAEPPTSDIHSDGPNDTSTPGRQENGAVSPLPSAPRSTPSLSPQSSDAENQPPSRKPSKPSASRAPAPTPSKKPSVRAPLAVSTPSPSKRNANAGNLKTSQPWTPIDIESIIFARGSDKENSDLNGKPSGDLSSPEKKMTVEEWVIWNAKNGEERLRQECERLVSHFEKEGGRAMRVLEGIECID